MTENLNSIETFDGMELIEATLLHNVSGAEPSEIDPIGCVASK